MPATLTSRLKLVKAALIDAEDITVNVNPSFDIVDAEIGLAKVAGGSGLPGAPYDGQIRWDRNDGFIKAWDSANAVWQKLMPGVGSGTLGGGTGISSWETFVPTLANVTLGTPGQASYGQCIRLPGNMIWVKCGFVLGTGGSLTGVATIALPAQYPIDISIGSVGQYRVQEMIGKAVAMTSVGGATRQSLTAFLAAVGPPGTVNFQMDTTAGGPGNVSTATPFTWAVASQLDADLFYRTSAA